MSEWSITSCDAFICVHTLTWAGNWEQDSVTNHCISVTENEGFSLVDPLVCYIGTWRDEETALSGPFPIPYPYKCYHYVILTPLEVMEEVICILPCQYIFNTWLGKCHTSFLRLQYPLYILSTMTYPERGGQWDAKVIRTMASFEPQ